MASGRAAQAGARRPWSAPTVVFGFAALAALAGAALLAPAIAPFDPLAQIAVPLLEPAAPHWLGTDELGRDILTRILYGLRLSLLTAAATAAAAAVVGVMLGLVSGYVGGWPDALMMRLVDVILSAPGVLLAIVLVSIFGVGLTPLIIAIAIVGVPPFARLTRASVLSVKERPYVLAARAAGAPPLDILFRTVLPNVLGPAAVQLVVTASTAILTESGLSFLGLGAPPPAPTLGGMLASGNENLFIAPFYPLVVGLAIGALVASFDLLGAGLQKVWGGAGRGAVAA